MDVLVVVRWGSDWVKKVDLVGVPKGLGGDEEAGA